MDLLSRCRFVMNGLLCSVTATLLLAGCGGGGGSGNCSSLCPKGVTSISTALGVAVTDFNGDGRPDVALAVSEGAGFPGYAAVYLHGSASGKGYAARQEYPANSYPDTVVAADLNGDGLSDIVMNGEGTVTVLLNDHANPGTFTLAQTLILSYAGIVATVDMNGDSLPDLVTYSGAGNGSIQVALQIPGSPGTFAAPVSLYSGLYARAVGDLNGDGVPDVVADNHTQAQVLYLTPSSATPTIASTQLVYTGTNGGYAATVADVDGDGHNDIVIWDPGAKTIVVLLQNPQVPGTFLPQRSFALPAGSGGVNIVVADVNGDGHPDLVNGGDQAVAVFLQDPSHPGDFLSPTGYPAANAIAVAVADIDEDGHPDIVTQVGVSTSVVNGVQIAPPGVLYQDATRPGTFFAVQDLK